MADEIRTLAEGANIAYDILEGTSSSDWFAYYAKHVLMQKNAMTNLITNGNFTSTSGWNTNSGTVVVSNNVATITLGSTNTYFNINIYSGTVSAGHQYYARFGFSCSQTSPVVRLMIYNHGVTSAIASSLSFIYSVASQWEIFSGIVTATVSDNAPLYLFYPYQTSPGLTVGSTASFRQIIIIDLTATFGAGNEPDKAYMDALLARLFPSTNGWFDGTDTTVIDSQYLENYVGDYLNLTPSTTDSYFVTATNASGEQALHTFPLFNTANIWNAAQIFPSSTTIGSLSPRFVFQSAAVSDVWSLFGSTASTRLSAGAYTTIRWGESTEQPTYGFIDSVSFAAGGFDTFGIFTLNWSSPFISFAAGNGVASPSWDREYSLPLSGTLAGLETAQTWTATQIFSGPALYALSVPGTASGVESSGNVGLQISADGSNANMSAAYLDLSKTGDDFWGRLIYFFDSHTLQMGHLNTAGFPFYAVFPDASGTIALQEWVTSTAIAHAAMYGTDASSVLDENLISSEYIHRPGPGNAYTDEAYAVYVPEQSVDQSYTIASTITNSSTSIPTAAAVYAFASQAGSLVVSTSTASATPYYLMGVSTLTSASSQTVYDYAGAYILAGKLYSGGLLVGTEDEHIQNMLHLGYYDTYTIDSNGNYVVTRQTGYIKGDSNNLKATNISHGGLFQVVLDLSTYPAISYSSISDIESNYPKKTVGAAWTSSSGSIAYSPDYNHLEMYATGCDTADSALAYFLANPIFVQYKLSTPYTETYDPLHFARIQPYALEYAKKEADRSSNLLDYSRLDPSVATYSGSTINILSTSFYNKSMFNGDVVGGDGVPSDYSKLIKVKRGTYTLSATNTGGYDIVLQAWTLTGTRLSSLSFSNNGQASVSVSQDCYLDIRRYPTDTAFSITNLMLVEGSNPLPYQPYEGPVAHLGSTQTWTAAQNLGTGTTINGATIVTSLTISYDSSTQTLTLF